MTASEPIRLQIVQGALRALRDPLSSQDLHHAERLQLISLLVEQVESHHSRTVEIEVVGSGPRMSDEHRELARLLGSTRRRTTGRGDAGAVDVVERDDAVFIVVHPTPPVSAVVTDVQRRLAARRAAQRARWKAKSTTDLHIDLRELHETLATLQSTEHGVESAKVWSTIAAIQVELRRRGES